VEKNDLSPHSATKTKRKVLAAVLAADSIPAPFPENSENASSAWLTKANIKLLEHNKNLENSCIEPTPKVSNQKDPHHVLSKDHKTELA